MGLEGIELVMEFEDTFGIQVKDEEIEKFTTPRTAGDLIFSKLHDKDENRCQSQRAFYMLRGVFGKMFHVDRKSMRPDMQFRHLIPKEQEKEKWEQIRAAVSARTWPALELPVWMSRLLVAAASVIFVAVIVGMAYLSRNIVIGSFVGFYLGMVLVLVLLIAADKTISPLRIFIPSRFQCVRDIIPYAITSDRMKWTREGVSLVVREIVTEQLGIDKSDYTEDSRFVEDFGLN